MLNHHDRNDFLELAVETLETVETLEANSQKKKCQKVPDVQSIQTLRNSISFNSQALPTPSPARFPSY